MFFIIIPCAICGCGVFLLFFCVFRRFLSSNKSETAQLSDFHSTHFSVSDYYERMERASIEVQREKAQQKAYKLTLWAGLDGLQMNEDGSTQWIKRGETKQPKSPLLQELQNVAFSAPTAPTQNLCNIQNQILSLQAQNQALALSQFQAMQNQNTISAIHPYYTATIPAYYPPISQCCCSYIGR